MKPPCETRQKLLIAAVELMWESSYGSVSVDDICCRAQVRKGSFYYFFPSKCDLAVSAINAMWQRSKPVHDEIFSPQVPPLERMIKYCSVLLEVQRAKLQDYGKVCGCPYFTLGAEMSTQEEKIRLTIEEIAARYRLYYEVTLREMIEEKIIPPCDPVLKARDLLAFFSGCLLQAKVTNSLKPLENLNEGVGLLLGITLTPSSLPTDVLAAAR